MSDLKEFVRDKFIPGRMNIIYGPKGDGKSFAALSIAQNIMEGHYGHENVAMITNILMGRVTSGKYPVKGAPPGVFYEDTIAGSMKKVGEILDEYGRGCMILWLLDEAQNFMMADQNAAKENQAMKMFLANTRKFGMCNFFMTPALGNLGPRIRNYSFDKVSGYCNFQWMKSRTRAEKIAPRGMDYRDIIFVRGDGKDVDPVNYKPVVISPGTWGRDLYSDKSLKPGDYAFDTLSTADLKMGQNAKGEEFNFYKFLEATSGDLSHKVPEKIADFFAKWDEEGTTDGNKQVYISQEYQMQIIHKMRQHNIPYQTICDIMGMPYSTLYNRYRLWIKNQAPSELSNCPQESPAPVYINPIEGEEKGFFDPLESESDEGGCQCSS